MLNVISLSLYVLNEFDMSLNIHVGVYHEFCYSSLFFYLFIFWPPPPLPKYSNLRNGVVCVMVKQAV